MLYSIGYQRLRGPDELIAELKARGIEWLVDVRSKPYGRLAAFNRKALEAALAAAGIRYLWRGDRLGGFNPISDEAIRHLAEWQGPEKACLMCMEADPLRCHRYQEIGRRLKDLGVVVRHIVRDRDGAESRIVEN